jgi:TolB-like protein/Tfp pilus assembly protein PilF
MGTVGYMSPEQVRGQAADFRSDIFAFGAILYETLSSQRAFTGESSADVASAILNEDPQFSKSIASVPEALETIMRRCLEKTPEQRFQSVEELTAALRGIETEPAGGASAWRIWRGLRSGWQPKTSAIILAIVAVAVLVSLISFHRREALVDSIAVMPFASRGADTGAELSDGLTSGLIDSLSQIPNLRVISRNSVSHYKGREIDPQAIGRELHVQAVLTGTLVQSGDNLVLDAELVNASDNTHLWGQQYTSKPADALTLQAGLAQAISTRLRPRLATEAKTKLANPGTSNPEAYALYVKGRYAADGFYAQDWKKALAYFQQAVEKDPGYPQAHAGVGEAYVALAHYRSVPLWEGVQKGRAAAHRAMGLNGNLAEAHCVLGAAAYMVWEFKEMEDEARRCVELNPNLSIAHQYYSFGLSTLGKMDQALAEIKRARELDPVSFTSNLFVALDYYWLRDYDRAIEESLKILEVEPNQTELRNYLARSYVMKHEYDKAAAEFEKALTLSGKDNQAEALRSAYVKDGLRGLLKAEIELWSHPEKPEDYDPNSVAENYALLGDRENTFLWLDRAYAENDKLPNGNLLDVNADPFLDSVRSDPRFNAFLRRMGFPP